MTGLIPDHPPGEVQRLLVGVLVAALGVWLHECEINEAPNMSACISTGGSWNSNCNGMYSYYQSHTSPWQRVKKYTP